MIRTKHVQRMLFLLLALGVSAFIAQRLLRPESFGKAGHFRYDSLGEIISQEPVHQSKAACIGCHGEICKLHDKDIHFGVQCEDCHGPGQRHVLFHEKKDASVLADAARMPKEYTLEGCLFCHRKLAARPRTFPQIAPEEHYKFLHVSDPKTRCIECHSPHEPLYLLTNVEEARIHPIIQECRDCHDGKPEKDHKEVKNHPVIFVCRDCHAAVAEDFQSREHAFLECTACHLFHRENDTAGRIFKNGNRKFCLLCHEAKPFKDSEGMPQVDSAKHLADMAERAKKDPKVLQEDPKACLGCHFVFIHDPAILKSKKSGATAHE